MSWKIYLKLIGKPYIYLLFIFFFLHRNSSAHWYSFSMWRWDCFTKSWCTGKLTLMFVILYLVEYFPISFPHLKCCFEFTQIGSSCYIRQYCDCWWLGIRWYQGICCHSGVFILVKISMTEQKLQLNMNYDFDWNQIDYCELNGSSAVVNVNHYIVHLNSQWLMGPGYNSDLSDMAELPSFSPPAWESTIEYRRSPLRQTRMRTELKAAPVYI